MAYYGETRRDKIVEEVRTARRANGEEQQNIVRYLHNRVIALELNRVQLSVRGAALYSVEQREGYRYHPIRSDGRLCAKCVVVVVVVVISHSQ